MITCPNCKQTLPDFVVKCQFCGADTKSVPRFGGQTVHADGFEEPDLKTGSGLSGLWVRRIYYGLGIFWLVMGLLSMVLVIISATSSTGKQEATGFDVWTFVGLMLGFIQVLISIGYLARVRSVMKVVNFFAALGVLANILKLIGGLMSIMIFGPIGLVFIVGYIFNIIVNGGVMWIIGESDRPDAFPL